MMNEDWELLLTFLPAKWAELGRRTEALKGLHGDVAPGAALRLLLLHVGQGLSLRETAVRARQAGVADLSDVGVLKRLRKSREWLRQLCVKLFRERGLRLGRGGGRQIRVLAATTVKEPGQTGSVWRVHYSLRLPALQCDCFKITATKGRGTGESFRRFQVRPGEYLMADRGYRTAAGLATLVAHGAFVTVRVNSSSLPLATPEGQPFPLVAQLATVTQPGAVACWPVQVMLPDGQPLAGRLCVLRKSAAATTAAQERLQRRARRNGQEVQATTLVVAGYVILFTTFPPTEFSPAAILAWYRLRWQVELGFKRLKQLAGLGHLPKRDPVSAEAWLYGKLLVALITDKLLAQARAFSPWGYAGPADPQPLARVRVHAPPSATGDSALVAAGRGARRLGADRDAPRRTVAPAAAASRGDHGRPTVGCHRK